MSITAPHEIPLPTSDDDDSFAFRASDEFQLTSKATALYGDVRSQQTQIELSEDEPHQLSPAEAVVRSAILQPLPSPSAAEEEALLGESQGIAGGSVNAAGSSSHLDFEQESLDAMDGSSALLDKETRRNLLDIESSFMPEEGPSDIRVTSLRQKGADDTFLFAGSPGRTRDLTLHYEELDQGSRQGSLKSSDRTEPLTPASAYKTPYPEGDQDSSEATPDQSISEIITSPAAAAAKRAQRRSVQETEPSSTSQQDFEYVESNESSNLDSMDARVMKTIRNVGRQPSTNAEHYVSPQGPDLAPQGPIVAIASPSPAKPSPRTSRRPTLLHSRHGSVRSSTSFLSHLSELSENSETTLGADYALQSGGAAPATGVKNRPSFSRLPSVTSISGSVLSGLEGSSNEWSTSRSTTSDAGRHDGSRLSALTAAQAQASEASPPLTPRPFMSSQAAPSDTVIAQRVENIKVPETIAREYRQMHPDVENTQRKQANSLSFGKRNNLTLKEQNSKIDKLSKENFDLKLKIHFLDQALQNRSDEGVKDMISKNVQLQTDLANEKKENQSLRRKMRDLERKLKALEEGRMSHSSNVEASNATREDQVDFKAELEEEIFSLREIIQQTELEIDRLREDNINKEIEKRRLAEHVKNINQSRAIEQRNIEEESGDMWRDLLEAETARREQADLDAAALREELFRLKGELSNVKVNSLNVVKRGYTTRSDTGSTEGAADRTLLPDSRASTLVDTLQHENAELRRDLSAQTQMLTSRNRERERLQQEIEDLKLHNRRGPDGRVRSVAGDSIFERSVSRAHQRSGSRGSAHTRATQLSDQERDDYDRKQANLRDDLAQMKMVNQDLERELNAHLDILQTAETENTALKEEVRLATEDLQALQSERDEALEALQEREEQFEQLREEALTSIEELEQDLEQKEQDFAALQAEMKTVSEAVLRLEHELEASRRKEASIEQQIEENEQELEALEKKLRETVAKNEVLDVQLESSQNEVAFLREEQDADKIRLGELEAALSLAQTSVQEEKDRMREMRARLSEEKKQRERLESQEKQSAQRLIDELNVDGQRAKEEIRKLKKGMQLKEEEAIAWKDRLEALEGNLREALGDLNGTRSSLSRDVTTLARDLERTISQYETAKADLADREALLRSRDTLLETNALETRKLTEMLEKERTARQKDRTHFDQMQRSQQSLTRTIQQNDNRVAELEGARGADRRRWHAAENNYVQQLQDRNSLLLSLWTKLSNICSGGSTDGDSPGSLVKTFGLIDGAVPSVEVIARNLPGFARNLNVAARTVEVLVQGFRARIRDVERSLWRDVQKLEHGLELRTRRIDHLEKMVAAGAQLNSGPPDLELHRRSSSRATTQSGIITTNVSSTTELAQLKNENKMLKSELIQAKRNLQPSPTRPPSISSVIAGIPGSPGEGPTLRRTRGPHNSGGHRHQNSVESAVAAMPLPHNATGTMPSPPAPLDVEIRRNTASPVPHIPTGPSSKDRSSNGPNPGALSRHNTEPPMSPSKQREMTLQSFDPSQNLNRTHQSLAQQELAQGPHKAQPHPAPNPATEQRALYRLKELERRLKAERELRLLDRSGARKRIEEERGEKEELRRLLEKERELRDATAAVSGSDHEVKERGGYVDD